MSDVYQSLAHSKWDCKYHVVFVPKRRRKAIFEGVRRQLGPIFRALAKQKDSHIVEGHLMVDHMHMCIAIPPEHPVASVIGFLKEKAQLQLHGCTARRGTFQENTSGHAGTPCPP
jgi:putative transposase